MCIYIYVCVCICIPTDQFFVFCYVGFALKFWPRDVEMAVLSRCGFLMVLGGGEGEVKKEGKKKFITREEEPEQ